MQVLIVDDSVSARFSLKRSLERLGIAVEAASSAEDGIALLGTTQFDAIFMDHVLPQMDGLEAVTAIRRMDAYSTTPIIMCSSNDEASYIEQAMNAGANSVIRKPPEPEQLETVVAALRGGRMVPTMDEPTPDFSSTQEVPAVETPAAMPSVDFPEPDAAPSADPAPALAEPQAAPAEAPSFDEPEPAPAEAPTFSEPDAEPDWAPESEPDTVANAEASPPEIVVTEPEVAEPDMEVGFELSEDDAQDSSTTVLSTAAHGDGHDSVDVPDSHRVEVKVDTRELKRLVTHLDGISQRLANAEQTLQRVEQLADTVSRLDALEQSMKQLLESLPAQLGEATRTALAERLQAAAAALSGAPDSDA